MSVVNLERARGGDGMMGSQGEGGDVLGMGKESAMVRCRNRGNRTGSSV